MIPIHNQPRFLMINYVRFLPLSLLTLLTLFGSALFPPIGNVIMMLLGTIVLFASRVGSNQWLMYLPIGMTISQLALMVPFGFRMTDMNAISAVSSFIAWAIGCIVGNKMIKKVSKING